MMQFNSSITVTCLEDVCQVIKDQVGYKVDSFTSEDIERVKAILPAKLAPLRGALKIHQLVISATGDVRAKCLPTDPTFFNVKTDCNFNNLLGNRNRLEQPVCSIYPDESNEE